MSALSQQLLLQPKKIRLAWNTCADFSKKSFKYSLRAFPEMSTTILAGTPGTPPEIHHPKVLPTISQGILKEIYPEYCSNKFLSTTTFLPMAIFERIALKKFFQRLPQFFICF